MLVNIIEERIGIVLFCIANANDYKLTAEKFNVSYQQVWIYVNILDGKNRNFYAIFLANASH